jgi:hypothetical protein
MPFCGFDPAWASLSITLWGWFNKDYGGMVLFGPCPRCEHEDGINVFIPTTWATTTATITSSPGPAAFTGPVAAERREPIQKVQWLGPFPDTPGPEARPDELVEVVVCRCGLDHQHQPPSGRSGCGYWSYFHLRKGTVLDGQ